MLVISTQRPFLFRKRAAIFISSLDSVAVGKSLEGVVGWDFCCVLTLQLCQQVLGHDG